MRDTFETIFQCIVGSECGFTGEGNEQWYYTIALVINIMLTWITMPKIAIIFTILSIIHLITVFIYGYNDLGFENKIYSILYALVHLILIAIALFTSFYWTILTSGIVIIAVAIAPDCVGKNIFNQKTNSKQLSTIIALSSNTLIFVSFVVVTCMLSIVWWWKALIIASAILLHPFIDYLEDNCIVISDVTSDVLNKLTE